MSSAADNQIFGNGTGVLRVMVLQPVMKMTNPALVPIVDLLEKSISGSSRHPTNMETQLASILP